MISKRFKAVASASCIPLFCGLMSTSTFSSTDESNTMIWQCPSTDLYFCDDFSNQDTANWNLLPETANEKKPDGTFTLINDNGNSVLQYTANESGGIIALVTPEALNTLETADYYVDAKIRPRNNTITSNKQLYLLGRYQDGNNWYAGALNIQNSPNTTQVEVARMVDGNLTRMQQVKAPITQGKAGELDGQWYSLRLTMKGNNLKVYLNGDELINTTDDSFSDKGLIGLWTDNKSFEIDDVRVGNADDLPAFLTLSPNDTEYYAEVGDEPGTFDVTAVTESGEADIVTATSSNDAVVAVTFDNNQLTLTPVSEGEAVITISSASGLRKTINASIDPAFVMPVAVYDFSCQLSPFIGEFNAYEDTQLTLKFDADVTLGKGSVRIFLADTDEQIDKINLRNETDTVGYGNVRVLNTDPVRIDGRTVRITPHANTLKAGKTYYVAISAEAFTGATLAGQEYQGIGKNSAWTFTTRAEKPDTTKTRLVVDDTGKYADFRTVQGALNFAMQYHDIDTPVTIQIRNGIYEEPLYLYNKNNVTLQGETHNNTIIRYKNNESMNTGSNGRPLFLVSRSDNLNINELTFKNTTLIGDGHQAETLYYNVPDGRLVVTNSVFISEQDTLNLKGWNWFYNCRVEGNVDFIWGYSKATLFENCEIRTVGDSRGKSSGGYILQARNEHETDKGFVFLNSRLTRGNGPQGHPVSDESTYLARSGGCSNCYDNIVFVNTQMGDHIRPVGYLDKPASLPEVAYAGAGWREYNTMDLNGNPKNLSERLPTMFYELNADEVKEEYCTRTQVFSAYNNGNGWNPAPWLNSICEIK